MTPSNYLPQKSISIINYFCEKKYLGAHKNYLVLTLVAKKLWLQKLYIIT